MKLTATQNAVLSAAAEHPEGRVDHFPEKVRGGARVKVLTGLEARGLVRQVGGHPVITDEGYQAIGRECPVRADTAKPRRTRENSKQAEVIRMLRRPEGATIAQIRAATGWAAHTVRGHFSGSLNKKLGLNLVSERTPGADRVYRIAD